MIRSLISGGCLILSLGGICQQQSFADYQFDQKGFTLSGENYKLNIGTLLQYDVMRANADKTSINDGHGWRDERLNITGDLGTDWGFKIGFDFKTETWKDVWFKNKQHAITFGQFKSQVGMENQQSARWWYFNEASMATTITPQRFIGVKWQPVFADRYMLALAIQQANLNDDDSMSEKPLRLGTRLVYSPFHKDGETLHLGGSFQWADYKDDNPKVSIGVPPEVKFEDMPKLGTTGTIKAKNSQSSGLELGYGKGPISLMSEYTYYRIESRDKDLTYKFQSAYAQASFFLDNSTYRTYSLSDGTFGKPSSTDMTWEIAGRVSWLDLEDQDIKGGSKTNYALGLNFYPNLNLKLSLDYVNSTVRNGPNGDENPNMVLFRTQLAF